MKQIETLATRLSRVAESATLKMAKATREVRAQGHPVINFTVGEPNYPVPAAAQDAAISAIREGFSKYTPVPGIPELRGRLARKLDAENGLTYSPEQIVVSCGAKQAIYNFFMAVLDEGDEVIIPAPYWTSYPEMAKLAGGDTVIVPTTESSGFKMTPAQLKEHLTPRSRVLMINSPSNPTGSVYSKEELRALAKVLEGTSVVVCSDEIYERLLLDEVEFTSFGAVSKDAFSRTVTVNGFSKVFAMTGWRLGYAAGPKKILDAMSLIQGQCTSGANSVAQKAALAALDIAESSLRPQVDELRKRRNEMAAIFSESSLLSFVLPPGAFYLFLNIGKALKKKTPGGEVIATSDDLALYLLRECYVGTVAGAGFGDDNYLRLSFAVSKDEVAEGSRRIVKALEQLR